MDPKRRIARAALPVLLLLTSSSVHLTADHAEARGFGQRVTRVKRATQRLSKRVMGKARRWARNVGIVLAPVRVKKLRDGSIRQVHWAFSKAGKPIPKKITTQMPDGRQFVRTLSYVKNTLGQQKLESTTIESIAGKLARPTIRTFSLADKRGTVTQGEATTTKRLTRGRALRQAVLGSPAVHFAGTTSFFFAFWHTAPAALGWQLSSGQMTGAALGTKGLTLPLVTFQAVRELRLQREK